MELRHLRYFVAVAEEQNVTRASARLHVSQPPLSRQIRDLEEELNVPLFHRSGKSVRLTDAGRIFLDEARAVLKRVEEATCTVRAFASGKTGELHVGYAPSLTVEVLPRALRQFEQHSPGVRIVLHDLSTQEMLTGLRDGQLHIALMIRPHNRALKGMTFHELRRYAVCVAVSTTHPLANYPKPTLARIWQERLIAYAHKNYPEYHEWLTSLADGKQPRIAEEHDGATSLAAAIEAGRGIALVPETFSGFAGNRIILQKVHGTVPPFIVGLVCLKTPSLPAVAAFLKFWS
jgi:DNA-binding transcriptional LysR family regulator